MISNILLNTIIGLELLICSVMLIYALFLIFNKTQYRSRCSCGWVGDWYYFKFRAHRQGVRHYMGAVLSRRD